MNCAVVFCRLKPIELQVLCINGDVQDENGED